ncbi:MAG: response regulator [Alphaproteobacteria bacterium]|nr:response regulator [Alphaproteobacteria bacterium]
MAYELNTVTALIVEDNYPMREITKALLESFGVGTVVVANDGEEGLHQYKKTNPDIIILDWMMEHMNGLTFTVQIRNDKTGPNPYVPIILMTGFNEENRVKEARDCGITEYLAKPFTAKTLYSRVTQVIERPRPFVQSEDFLGPDRRRTKTTEYGGPLRRHDDVAPLPPYARPANLPPEDIVLVDA